MTTGVEGQPLDYWRGNLQTPPLNLTEMLQARVSEVDGAVVHQYERPTAERMASRPTLEDPYERRMVQVGPSRLGGEGLFIKKDTPKATLLAYFSGFLIPVDSIMMEWEAKLGCDIDSLQPGRCSQDPSQELVTVQVTADWRSTWRGRVT